MDKRQNHTATGAVNQLQQQLNEVALDGDEEAPEADSEDGRPASPVQPSKTAHKIRIRAEDSQPNECAPQ